MFVRILQALGSTSLVLAVLYYWFPGLVIGRGVFTIASIFVISFVIAWRVGFEWVQPARAPWRTDPAPRDQRAVVSVAKELYERRSSSG